MCNKRKIHWSSSGLWRLTVQGPVGDHKAMECIRALRRRFTSQDSTRRFCPSRGTQVRYKKKEEKKETKVKKAKPKENKEN